MRKKTKQLHIRGALNENGDVVLIKEARKGEKYFCPCCNEKLILRNGKIKVKHFSHPNTTQCSIESIEHKLGKMLIEMAINENIKGQNKIIINKKCLYCQKNMDVLVLEKFFHKCGQEIRVGKFICDVLAEDKKGNQLAIEVFNTHRMGDEKEKALAASWIELNVDDIFNDYKYWRPIKEKTNHNLCNHCLNKFKNIVKICDKYNINKNLYTPIPSPYIQKNIANIIRCYKCKNIVPIFIVLEKETPRTIKYTQSKDGKSKYLNTCICCNKIFDDFILYYNDDTIHMFKKLSGMKDYEFEKNKNILNYSKNINGLKLINQYNEFKNLILSYEDSFKKKIIKLDKDLKKDEKDFSSF